MTAENWGVIETAGMTNPGDLKEERDYVTVTVRLTRLPESSALAHWCKILSDHVARAAGARNCANLG